MALLDLQNTFTAPTGSGTGSVAATGNSDIIDMGASTNLGEKARLGLLVHLSRKSGTTPTIAYNLVGADDAAFSVNKITIMARATVSDPAVPSYVRDAIPNHVAKRYFRLEYTIGGTESPYFDVNAALVLDQQTTIPLV